MPVSVLLFSALKLILSIRMYFELVRLDHVTDGRIPATICLYIMYRITKYNGRLSEGVLTPSKLAALKQNCFSELMELPLHLYT